MSDDEEPFPFQLPFRHEIFRENARRFNWVFEEYRRVGQVPYSTGDRPRWKDRTIPRNVSARVKFENVLPFNRQTCIAPPRVNIVTNRALSPTAERARSALNEFRAWFATFTRVARRRNENDKPAYTFQRVLGWGGQGMAVHFKYGLPDKEGQAPDKQDIVVKFSINALDDESILSEEKMTNKVRRSAHCIQLVEPQSTLIDPERRLIRKLRDDDSSIDGDSSGDESHDGVDVPDWFNNEFLRQRRRENRRDEIMLHNEMIRSDKSKENPRYNLLILEYMSNGDLSTLIGKLAKDRRNRDWGGRIPNRVLWSFWLCLIRACIAMEYPPRKFHPDRKKPEPSQDQTAEESRDLQRRIDTYNLLGDDLIENIPANVNRRQNLVHFDIDPSNVFIGDLELSDSGEQSWGNIRKKHEEAAIAAARARNQEMDATEFKPINSVGKRTDRGPCEHEFVPKLKLADFGVAEPIKRGKRNEYYFNRRTKGKVTFYAPEQFGHEWDNIAADPSHSITPNTPSYSISDADSTINLSDLEAFSTNFPLGAMQIVHEQQGVQSGLLALSHSLEYQLGPNLFTDTGAPIQNPTFDDLFQLWDQITQGAVDRQAGIGDISELAGVLQDWGSDYGLNLDLGGSMSSGYFLVEPPRGIWRIWIHWDGDSQTWRGVRGTTDGTEPVRIPERIRYQAQFPRGTTASSRGSGWHPLTTGIRAIIYSFIAQFSQREISGIDPPTLDDILLSYQRWRANGRYPVAAAASTYPQSAVDGPGPMTESEIAGALFTWGLTQGLNFDLGVAQDNETSRIVTSGLANAWTLWIRSTDNGWVGLEPPRSESSLTPRSESSLSDYDSDGSWG
ncbi:hypothetical protein GGR53DRAFT_469470 [Hypoxylon sp. FL1150]|nr:hypothetical protein GGR53DRAFT_469470 [Hypoxylon sp. FL1150]